MKKVISLIALFSISSCATFKEKYSCNGTFESIGKKYRFCKIRGEEKWGIYSYPENKEVVPNDYISAYTFSKKSDRVLAKKNGEIIYFNISDQTPQKTNYTHFFRPPLFLGKSGKITVAIDKDNNIYPHDPMGKVTAKVEGISKLVTKNEYGQNLPL